MLGEEQDPHLEALSRSPRWPLLRDWPLLSSNHPTCLSGSCTSVELCRSSQSHYHPSVGLAERLAAHLAAPSQNGSSPFRGSSLLLHRFSQHRGVQQHILAIEQAPRQQQLMPEN